LGRMARSGSRAQVSTTLVPLLYLKGLSWKVEIGLTFQRVTRSMSSMIADRRKAFLTERPDQKYVIIQMAKHILLFPEGLAQILFCTWRG
jgi:hypothetical protein